MKWFKNVYRHMSALVLSTTAALLVLTLPGFTVPVPAQETGQFRICSPQMTDRDRNYGSGGTGGKKAKAGKATQNFKVKKSSVSFKATALKKKAASFKVKTVNGKGSLSWKSSSGYVSVSRGKVTVRKGTPRGTYKVTVKASGNSKYKSAKAVVRIIVR